MAGEEEWAYAGEGGIDDPLEPQGRSPRDYILVAMRGTSLRAKFRKQEAPWLAMDEYEEDRSSDPLLFRALAWEAANAKALLGWLRSCDEIA